MTATRKLVTAVAGLLAAVVTVAALATGTIAGWTVAVTNGANTYTTGTWAGPMYVWGHHASGSTGVIISGFGSSTAARMPGLESWASLSEGYGHTCGITTAGALMCWGSNGYGQLGLGDTSTRRVPTAVAAGTVWSSVATGYNATSDSSATCAIRTSDQSLWCWGYNEYGGVGNGTTIPGSPYAQTTPAQVTTTGVLTWSSVSIGSAFACGIKTDATLWCWGYGGNGRIGNGSTSNQTTPVQVGAATWSVVSASARGACAIKAADQSLWCWGQAASGQLGNNTTTPDVSSPVAVNGGGTWSKVTRGDAHSCGIKTDGSLWCWGYNAYGQLGNNSTSTSTVPVRESTNAVNWTAVVGLTNATCGLAGGTAYCWGINSSGQFGTGNTTNQQVPTAGAVTDWSTIAGGNSTVCGIRADAAIWCQGDNSSNQFGQYAFTDLGRPAPLSPPSGTFSGGSVGTAGGCGVRADGTLWCWGTNGNGEVGAGDTSARYFPVQVSGGGTTWRNVSMGDNTTCATRTDDSLWCWGNTANSLTGISGAAGNVVTPTAGPAGTWRTVSVGTYQTCAITTAGLLNCWGKNTNGEVGDGSTSVRATPVAVTATGVTTWSSVSAGSGFTCAIAATGANAGNVFCWGAGSNGQIGDGGSTQRVSPVKVGSATWQSVAAGQYSACGLQTGGTLWCWGSNTYGQLGLGGVVGTPATASTPQQIGALSTWRSVAVGDGHACATRADRSVWCWGQDQYMQLGDGATTSQSSPRQIALLSASWVETHSRASTTLAG